MAMKDDLTHLYVIASQPLQRSVSDVKVLAEAIWYDGFRLSRQDLEEVGSSLDRHSLHRLLCVLELLSQYPVCPQDTARELQRMTREFHDELPGVEPLPVHGRYSPSKRWGLAESTLPLRRALLPLQTRTYADSTSKHHGLSA